MLTLHIYIDRLIITSIFIEIYPQHMKQSSWSQTAHFNIINKLKQHEHLIRSRMNDPIIVFITK